MEYKKIKLKEIANINMGQSPKGSSYNNKHNGVPFLQGNKTFGRLYPTIDTWTTEPKKIGKKSSILMSVRAPVGELNIANQDICIGRGLCSINMKNGNNQYLYYLLINSIQAIKRKSTGTVFDSINRKELEEIEVLNFDEEHQKKIVSILFSIDKRIELNNQINDNLQELSNRLFKESFTNIEESKDAKLSEVSNIKYGKGLPTKNIKKIGYPVYGGNGIIGYYNEKMYNESQILISCRGAASGKVIFTKPNCFVTNNSLILECDRKYYYYLKELSLEKPYYSYTTGSAQPQITIDNIKDIFIKVPNDELLIRFNNIMKPIETKYFKNIEQNETLEQLRDTLLPKLMNGEIDLDKIEI